LADEDLRSEIVAATRRLEPSIEFGTVRDLGWRGWPDPDVLALAAERGWVIVSHDVNTMTAHAKARVAAGQPMAGLLLAPQFRGPARSPRA
jgi:predicted nuclease of predicted toxin-antitoxin system